MWASARQCAKSCRLIRSDRITILTALFSRDDLHRRLTIALNITKAVQHIGQAIRFENSEKREPLFDRARPIRSAGDMGTWYTGRPCERIARSHLNFCVYDSTRESTEAFELDHNNDVDAWVKNDHLGFEFLYIYRGVVRKYSARFMIRLASGEDLVLEVKGQDLEQDQMKRRFLDEWVKAVNDHGGFGAWAWESPRILPTSRICWPSTTSTLRFRARETLIGGTLSPILRQR